mgnify:CR=1 FL=1
MRSFEIENVKRFTSALFASELFDTFCVTQASFTTDFTISVDGHLTGDEDNCATWGKIRPLAYEILKGDKLPARFKIVLMTPPKKVEGFLRKSDLAIEPSQVAGLFINVIFEKDSLVCTTGTALSSFSLDKSVENAWDDSVETFLRKFA